MRQDKEEETRLPKEAGSRRFGRPPRRNRAAALDDIRVVHRLNLAIRAAADCSRVEITCRRRPPGEFFGLGRLAVREAPIAAAPPNSATSTTTGCYRAVRSLAPTSQSLSFDQRFFVVKSLTAKSTARFCPTSTTSCFPRVTPV